MGSSRSSFWHGVPWYVHPSPESGFVLLSDGDGEWSEVISGEAAIDATNTLGGRHVDRNNIQIGGDARTSLLIFEQMVVGWHSGGDGLTWRICGALKELWLACDR